VTTDSSSFCSIETLNLELDIEGLFKVKAEGGVCTFEEMSFSALPLTKNQFQISSDGVDEEKYAIVKGEPYEGKIHTFLLETDLVEEITMRECWEGEVLQSKK